MGLLDSPQGGRFPSYRVVEAAVSLAWIATVVFVVAWSQRLGGPDEDAVLAWGLSTAWVLSLPLCLVLRRGYLMRGQAEKARMCSTIPWCLLPGFVGSPVTFWWTENGVIAIGIAVLSLLCLGEVVRRADLPDRRERVLARVAAVLLYAAAAWGTFMLLLRAGLL